MQQPTEFIVYRNPLEAQMWHMLQGGSFFIVICGILAFFTSFLLLNYLTERVLSLDYRQRQTATTVNLILGAIVGIAVIVYMIL